MRKYEDLTVQDLNDLLSGAQSAEEDQRDMAREVRHFLSDPNGQWEEKVWNATKDRPRYTFDKCTPVVDSIAGEMEQADFDIAVRPASGDASGDKAKVINGLLRNIQAISNAVNVFNMAGREMIATGFDAWEVKTDWVDDDSFDQDFIITPISNAVDRVFFDETAELQTMEDADHCFVLQTYGLEAFKAKWPEKICMSVNSEVNQEQYDHKAAKVTIAKIYFKTKRMRKLALMSNGAVFEINDDFQRVQDEMAQQGVTVVRTREREVTRVKTRLFSGDDFLGPVRETVFSYLPIIPTYGNFKIIENKVIYNGVVMRLMDPQRVFNYAESRAIEEGALAPRDKTWMTEEQAAGHEDTLATMNTNADPVQFYTYQENQPAPFKLGAGTTNDGLYKTAQDMKENIIEAGGIFGANQGNAPGQSGIAIERQQNKGDNSTIKYFTSQEIAITHTGKVIVDALPRLYDKARIARILDRDGKEKMVQLNTQIVDQQSQQMVTLNDLRTGKYDVVCDVGDAFKNQQQQTVDTLLEAAAIDPTILEVGRDVFLSNLNSPGIELVAERVRKQMFEAGLIPDDQMTDDEKEEAMRMIQAAQQQGQQPSIMEQAVMAQTQMQGADVKSRIDERIRKLNIQERKVNIDEARFRNDVDNNQVKLLLEQQQAVVDMLKTQAETLNMLREAMGPNVTIVSGGTADAYQGQVEKVEQAQHQ